MVFAGIFAIPISLTSITSPAYAVNVLKEGKGHDGLSKAEANGEKDINSLVSRVIYTLLFLIGAIAVIAIIIGGIRYTTSNGDQGQIKSAKDTIMYACIGLVVAIMAGGIVNFVVNRF